MTSCSRCPRPARWRTSTEALCGTHAADEALRGRPVALAPLEDVADRLEAVGGAGLLAEAAAEIRSLRARVAALEAGQSAGDRPLASGGRLDGGSVTQTHGG